MPQPAGSWTYTLLTPDALVTESLAWLMQRLQSSGLQPVVGRLVRVQVATMLRIYDLPSENQAPSLPPRRPFELWYSLGPGCILLLHHDGPDATGVMLSVKGATLPEAASPDSIRYAGENGLMNLVHCPDDESAAARELALLLGPACAGHVQRLAMEPSERVRHLTVDSLQDALPTTRGRLALSLPLIVNRIRLRLVQQLAVEEPRDDCAVSHLIDAESALRDEREAIAQLPTSSGRMSVAQAYDERLHDLLVKIAERIGNATIVESLLGLHTMLTGPHGDWPKTSTALATSGTYVSDMESAVLEIAGHLH